MKIIQLILFNISVAGAFMFTAKMLYHMYYVITNITGKYSSFFGPFILLMPNQFNSKGNEHRNALVPVFIGLILCWLILVLTSSEI
jgi:hypothetical protein